MSQKPATAPAKQVSSLSDLHNLQPAGGHSSKSDVSSTTAVSGGAGATASSDLNLHGGGKQHLHVTDLADAVSARFAGVSQQFGTLEAKVDGLAGMLQQFLSAQQQQGGGSATAAAKPAAVETKHLSASASLTHAQEVRLGKATESVYVTNASVLGTTKAEQKAISAVLESKVSSASGSFAGSAGSSGEQDYLEHLRGAAQREVTALAKIANLGQAKTYPELVRRLFKQTVNNSNDKSFLAFMENHIVILADYNDSRSWAAAKYYHYEVFDQLSQQTDEADKARFYQTNENGHSYFIGKVIEKFQPRRDKQQQQGNGRGGKGNRGNRGGGNGDSFRDQRKGGGGRGAGRGGPSTEASLV